MMQLSFARVLALALFTAALGCKNDTVRPSNAASSGSSGADISPAPPTFNQEFETRNPRVCGKVTHVPNEAEAAIMVQCEQEATSNTTGASPGLSLDTDVVVQIGSPKPYNPGVDNYWHDIDPTALVYPLRGSSTDYGCIPVNDYNRGKNCIKSSGGGMLGQGACFHTQFNEWRCQMTMGGKDREMNVKGPTTF